MKFIFLSPGKSRFKIKWFKVIEVASIRKFPHSKSDIPVYVLRKVHMTTPEALEIVSEKTGVPKEKIGYAGLKDKYDETFQYTSLPKKVDGFSEERIGLEFAGYVKSKLKPGHLVGNKFEIEISGEVDERTLDYLGRKRIYNYFGLQRFGVEKKNHIIGKKLCKKDKVSGMNKFFVQAYQSYLFNEAINRLHPNVPEQIPLPGKDTNPIPVQEEIMEKDGISQIPLRGEMRNSFLGPIDITFSNSILEFFLPKSSYATIVLQELLKSSVVKGPGQKN